MRTRKSNGAKYFIPSTNFVAPSRIMMRILPFHLTSGEIPGFTTSRKRLSFKVENILNQNYLGYKTSQSGRFKTSWIISKNFEDSDFSEHFAFLNIVKESSYFLRVFLFLNVEFGGRHTVRQTIPKIRGAGRESIISPYFVGWMIKGKR